MGLFDMLPKGSQVKIWDCIMKGYQVGDEVPMEGDYVVLLVEGGFVRVKNGVISDMAEDAKPRFPEDFPDETCYDKWGQIISSKDELFGTGMFGTDYHRPTNLDDKTS